MKPNNSMLAYAVLVYGGFECEPESKLSYFLSPSGKKFMGSTKT